jgi:hypothetical protein
VENKLVSHRESLQHLSTLGWYVLASPKSAGEKTRKRPVSEGKIRAQNRNQGSGWDLNSRAFRCCDHKMT